MYEDQPLAWRASRARREIKVRTGGHCNGSRLALCRDNSRAGGHTATATRICLCSVWLWMDRLSRRPLAALASHRTHLTWGPDRAEQTTRCGPALLSHQQQEQRRARHQQHFYHSHHHHLRPVTTKLNLSHLDPWSLLHAILSSPTSPQVRSTTRQPQSLPSFHPHPSPPTGGAVNYPSWAKSKKWYTFKQRKYWIILNQSGSEWYVLKVLAYLPARPQSWCTWSWYSP